MRISDGQHDLRPSPIGEDTLPLAGFYLIETSDPDHALEIAARIAAARLGGAVEIHPLVSEP